MGSEPERIMKHLQVATLTFVGWYVILPQGQTIWRPSAISFHSYSECRTYIKEVHDLVAVRDPAMAAPFADARCVQKDDRLAD